MNLSETLAIRLQERCNVIGINQAELARRIGVERQQIYNVTAKRNTLALATICKAAIALNCSIDYLVGLDDQPSRK